MYGADRIERRENALLQFSPKETCCAHFGTEGLDMNLRLGNAILTKCLLTFVIAALVLAAASWADDTDKDRSDIDKRIEASATVLDEIMATPDKAIPDKI